MKSREKCFLSLITLLYLIGIVRASIVHRPDILSTTPRSKESPRPDKTTDSTGETQLAGYGKFVLVTTGKQIKLYPLLADNRLSDDSISIRFARLNSITALKNVIERNERKKSEERTSKRDHDSILPKRFEKGHVPNGMNAKGSILPNNDQLEDHGGDHLESFEPHDRNSWLSDINYFLASRYCTLLDEPAQPNECLVIVWLDKANRRIGLGAIDLRLNAIRANQSRTLWAQQLPYEYLLDCNHKQCLERSEIVIDGRRKLLYINTVDVWSQHRISTYELAGPEADGLALRDALNVSPCHRTTMTNLNLDEDSGDWLFYSGERLNSTSNGEPMDSQQLIAALNVGGCSSGQVGEIPLKRALVSELYAHESQRRRFGLSSAAPDAANHRFYWLTERNELFSCDYVGRLVNLVGQLPAKPVIRAPGRTQVFQGSFYFSDSKRRLISYKLPAAADDDPSPSPVSQSSYRVLLIEEHNLENYRLLDLSSSSSSQPSNGEEKKVAARKRSTPVDDPASGGSFSSLQILFEDLIRLVVGDDYAILESRADGDWESCTDGERRDFGRYVLLSAFMFVGLVVLCFFANYNKSHTTTTASFGSKERLVVVVSKDKCPV